MRTSSAKAKGRRACQDVQTLLYKYAPQLLPGDIEVTSSGVTGEDLKLSPAARQQYPFVIECKNQEKINIWASIDQAKTHVKGDLIPLLFFKRNRSDLMVCLPAEEFFKLLEKK